MKRLFLFGFLSLVPMFMNGQPPDNDFNIFTEEQRVASYLKDLEEQGYCVIPQVFSTAEAEVLYQRVWYEFIEKAWPHCKMNDRSNWKETFPMHNKMGIFAGPAGQTQVMWDLRQDPRIVDVFAQVWNTSDLIVSMDGLSFMYPIEVRESFIEPWPHVDQTMIRRNDHVMHSNHPPIGFVSESSLKTQPYIIQGQFLFEDSFDGDGGFYCIPKSHLRFADFAPHLEKISMLRITQKEIWKAQNSYLMDFFAHEMDESGNPYIMKHVTAPRGSLILWDSRTVHWNQSSSKDRPYRDSPRIRMVGYLCHVPKIRLTDKSRALRKKAFEKGISTNHNPANPVLTDTEDLIDEEFKQYLEDPGYIQPKIYLTPLGQSLLGL